MVMQRKQHENGQLPPHTASTDEVAYGYSRDFLFNQFVYVVISPRARGLSIGVNFNPKTRCTFNCLYCEVDRAQRPHASFLDVDRLSVELIQTLDLIETGSLQQRPRYKNLPENLLQ